MQADKRIVQMIVCALLALLAACSSEPALPPTPEPLLPPITAASPAPTAIPQPTSTPIPLDQAVTPALGAPAGTPAAWLPMVSGGTASCLGATPDGVRLPGQRFGIDLALGATAPEQLLDLAHGMNAGWVRATLHWSDLEPQQGAYHWEPLDTLVAGAQARDLRVLLVVTGAPSWANPNGGLPDQPEQFGTFMDALARHAAGKISAYEIWQSPNTAAANGGTVAQPGSYAEVLKAAYDAIKGADRCALVLNGALFPSTSRDPKVATDDLAFYREMLKYRGGIARRSYDILATQLHTSGAAPNTMWELGQPALSRNYYNYITLLRDEMTADNEGDKQIWITQIGYQTAGQQAVAPEQQSEYLVETFERSRMFYPWISGIFVRELGANPDASAASYNLLNQDGTPRPAYERLRDYFAEQRSKREGNVTFPGTDLVALWQAPFPATQRLILAPHGAIYGGSKDGAVVALDPNGAFRRAEQISNNRAVLGIVFDQQGNLYMSAADGALVSSTAGGKLRWAALIDGVGATPLLISKNGQALYTGTGAERLEAYATNGGRKLWSTPLDGGIPGEPAMGDDGTIYIGTSEGGLLAIGPDGTLRWTYQAGSWVHRAPVVKGQTIYAASDAGAIFALGSDGSQLWRSELGAEVLGLAQAPDGTLYASTADSKLHALDPGGTEKWVLDLGGSRPTGPGVGADGRVYLGAEDGGFRVVPPDGSAAAVFDFHDPITAAPLVGSDGAVYVVMKDKREDYLVAFGPQELRERYRVP